MIAKLISTNFCEIKRKYAVGNCIWQLSNCFLCQEKIKTLEYLEALFCCKPMVIAWLHEKGELWWGCIVVVHSYCNIWWNYTKPNNFSTFWEKSNCLLCISGQAPNPGWRYLKGGSELTHNDINILSKQSFWNFWNKDGTVGECAAFVQEVPCSIPVSHNLAATSFCSV